LFSFVLFVESTVFNGKLMGLRVEFLVLKTDSGYPRDTEVTLFTLANPGSSLRFNTQVGSVRKDQKKFQEKIRRGKSQVFFDPLHRYEFGPPKFFSKTFKCSMIFYST